MNYEKAYKEALKRAKSIHNEHRAQCHDVMVKVFPELAESEDERIRKELIGALKQLDREKTPVDSYPYLEWVSWLKKQDNNKHTKLSEENDIDEDYKIGKWFTGLIPCWIDAPSTLQPLHNKHGKNIIAIHLKEGGYKCCCIDDEKPVVFTVAEDTSFVEGWRNREISF